jgi:hypothetical protein
VPLFTKSKKRAVQSFILNVVNNDYPNLTQLGEGPRFDSRVTRVIVAVVIPIEKKKLRTEEAFRAVTKEFSTGGVSLVLDGPIGLDEVVLGFRHEGEMYFVRAKAKHLNPMGGGFYQLGFEFLDMIYAGDYPQLKAMGI